MACRPPVFAAQTGVGEQNYRLGPGRESVPHGDPTGHGADRARGAAFHGCGGV